jgi:hypothetical protein
MALPKPTYPSYRPKSFLEPGAGGALTKALEIYSKYHPGAMQQRIYQTILEDETFQAKQRSEQRTLLAREREQVLGTLARFRETGLGPSGRGGGAAGGRRAAGRAGGGGYGNLDEYVKLSGQDTERLIKSKDMATEQYLEVAEQFRPSSAHTMLIDNIVNSGALRPGRTLDAAQLMAVIVDEADKLSSVLSRAESQQDPIQAEVAATRLWSRLTAADRFPGLVRMEEQNGQLVPVATPAGARIAALIDERFKVNILADSLSRNEHPAGVMEDRRRLREQQVGQGVGKSSIQVKLEGMMDAALSDDGQIDPTEQQRIDEFRKLHGLTSPLDAQEQEFLNRYVGALRDDGVATREELGADFDQAKAAYEKARNLERLPRGYAAFYDESYLRGLGRLAQIDEEMAGLGEFGSPMQTAARRTLGLPVVSAEALQAAGQVHPIAAEVLPYAMRRVMEAGGVGDGRGVDVEPKDRPEQWAAQYVQMERGDRDFGALVDAVNKAFPQDSIARRKALAYYGAYHYQQDMKGQSLSRAALTADVAAVPAERVEFLREIGGLPTPPPLTDLDPTLTAAAATELNVLPDAAFDGVVELDDTRVDVEVPVPGRIPRP